MAPKTAAAYRGTVGLHVRIRTVLKEQIEKIGVAGLDYVQDWCG